MLFAQDDLEILLRRCRKGDLKAWSQVVDTFQAHVFSAALRCGVSREEAEDVMQSTFLALYENLNRIEAAGALPKWLSTTAVRHAIRRKQTSSKRQTTSIDADDALPLQDVSIDVESSVLQAMEIFEIRQSMAAMPAKCRDLLTVLFSGEDLPYDEISKVAGIPIGSIGPTRARCLEKLRIMLEKTGLFKNVSRESRSDSLTPTP